MKQAVIHSLPDWQVTSYGNGLAYEIANRRTNTVIFFQGDDADIFRDCLDALTERRTGPQLDFADALSCIWSDYAESAENWGIRS